MAIARGGHGTSNTTAVTINTTGGSGSRQYYAVAWFHSGGENPTSVSDNKGNGNASQVQSIVAFAADANLRFACYRWVNFTGGATHTITTNFSTAPDVASCWAIEITGADSSDTDQTAAGLDDATSPYISNSVTTTVNNAIVIAFNAVATATGGTETQTHGNSFTELDSQANADVDITGDSSYRDLTATGTFNTSVTIAGPTVSDVITFIAAIQEAPAAGGGGGAPQSGLGFVGGMGGGLRVPRRPGRRELVGNGQFVRSKSGIYLPKRLAA